MESSEVAETPQTVKNKHHAEDVLSKEVTSALDAIRGLGPSATANLIPVICGNDVRSTRYAGERLMKYLRKLLGALHTRKNSKSSLSGDCTYDEAIVIG